jgi:hypothetical protein
LHRGDILALGFGLLLVRGIESAKGFMRRKKRQSVI